MSVHSKGAFVIGADFVPRLTDAEKATYRTLARNTMKGGTGSTWRKGRNLFDAIEASDHKTVRFYVAQIVADNQKR